MITPITKSSPQVSNANLRGPTALLLLCLSACAPHAGPLKDIDCKENKGKKLDFFFKRYPQKPQTVYREEDRPGVRFYLTPENVSVGQTMLYSQFVMAGDFEVSMTYERFEVPTPKTGYGISCGLAVDTENKDGTPGPRVHLARSSLVGQGDIFAVTVGKLKKGERGIDYQLVKSEPDPIKTKTGKLALKRVRDKLSCRVGDAAAPLDDLFEIYNFKFTDATVKKVRIFADQGGSPTLLDVYIDDVLVKAEEITFQRPQRDRPSWFWWIVAGVTFLVVGGAATVLQRRRR